MSNHTSFLRALRIASWMIRLIVAVILLQTLFFKFSEAAESIHFFTTVGQKPWGRAGTGTGMVELVHEHPDFRAFFHTVRRVAGLGDAVRGNFLPSYETWHRGVGRRQRAVRPSPLLVGGQCLHS